MSALSESGCGVQVVSVEEDGTYRVEMEALQRVLSHAAARALPACVVSVAGATRGGKSFLLDFFLRYLRATDEARRSGAWIGADDEPLTGFSWRGGSSRHTTGIVLWSLPIIVTQEHNGQQRKLAVFLMDTQGTFDNSSTVKDCTTIFAMSALISSIQIYNLLQIIREDDLQHLQLFTEYSKQARNDGGKPFQSLIFRVRDWDCPYEHPYGAAGGAAYLETVLKGDTKKQEIREVREHIRSSFETVTCILTPRPGKAVTDQNFNGRLRDLDPEFQDTLKEMIPLILDPKNLFPKVINGNEVLTEELLTYFRTYIDIFNSDELPDPVSIFQATSQANLETAVSAARAAYTNSMEARCGGPRSVATDAVPRLHAAALLAARETFAGRRTIASPALANSKLDALLLELDAMLSNYVAINRAKIFKALAESRAAYDAVIRSVTGDGAVCLHPQDLRQLHEAAARAALDVFDASRAPDDDDTLPDPDRNEMQQWVSRRGQELRTQNEANNRVAVARAGAAYTERARRAAAEGALGEDALRREHRAAKAAAVAAFAADRCRHCDDTGDTYYEELLENIKAQHTEWEISNRKNVKTARRTALLTYSNYMGNIWGPHRCLHPDLLRHEHHVAVEQAMEEMPSSEEEDFKALLASRFDEIKERNEAANAALVEQSYTEYCRRMDAKCTPSLSSLLIVPFFMKVAVQLPKYHETAVREVGDYFHTYRRASGDEDEDYYLDRLNSKLKAGYDVYCQLLPAAARELGFSIPE